MTRRRVIVRLAGGGARCLARRTPCLYDPLHVATVVYGDFEWDSGKAAINARKHKVTFEEATTVFSDPSYLLQADTESHERFLAIGMSGLLRILVVVHVERGPRLRVISARRASRPEARTYEARRN
jgi:uncharacterized DUF497 family protein